MEMSIDPNAMSQQQIDDEKSFLTTYGIMNFEEFTEFTDHRKTLNKTVLSGKATKEEVLIQINLESILLTTCQQKITQIMKETNTGDFKTEVPSILSNRINNMYDLLFKMFKFDIILVKEYLKFCSKYNILPSQCKIVLDELMDSFHRNPDVYILGANHAFNFCNDVESARRYISFGIKFHEDFKKLYVEDFWIEVQHLNKTGENTLQITLKKYNSVIQHFKDDINIHFALVDKSLNQKIKMTQLQSILIRDMIDRYRRNEHMWQKLAKIHLNGYIYNYDTEVLRRIHDPKYLDCIRNYINTYDKALKETSSAVNKRKLWSLLLDNLIEIHKSIDKKDKTNKDVIIRLVDQAFYKAFSLDIMKKPKHFIFWADCNNSDKDCELEILKKGLTKSNNSVDLWTKLFEYYINYDYLRNAMSVLFESTDIIKVKSLPLWEVMELYILSTEEEMIEKFYNQGSINVKVDEINLRFRPEYLEWRVLTYDIENGRQIFSVLKLLEPTCQELYKRMLRFETMNINSNGKRHIKYMRKLYSEACNKFGNMDVELWHDCIQFEYMYGIPSLVDVIYKAGLNLLEKPSDKDKLIEMKKELDEQFESKKVIQIEEDE